MPLVGQAKLDYMRRRYRKNPAPQIAYQTGYDARTRKSNPKQYRNVQYKRRYGITVDQFDEMVKAQNGLCAICQEVFPPTRKKLAIHIDHCHTTLRIRGLLCARCNVGLGLFGDSPERLKLAITYLEK